MIQKWNCAGPPSALRFLPVSEPFYQGRGRSIGGFDSTQTDFASRIGVSQSYMSAGSTDATKLGRKSCLRSAGNLVSLWNGYSQARGSSAWHQHLKGSGGQGSADSLKSGVKFVVTQFLA